MGLAFKENCPDIRNTRIIDIINELKDYDVNVDVYDPWVNVSEAKKEYSIELCSKPEAKSYDAIVLAVAHQHIDMGSSKIKSFGRDEHVLYDLKYVLSENDSDLRL